MAMAQSLSSETELRQMLTFAVDVGCYAVDICRVQEIRGWGAITPIPESPPHLLGVLDLRGCIVPIVDLRARLGLARQVPGATAVVIVISMPSTEQRLFGVVVDKVLDVIRLDLRSIHTVPISGEQGGATYLRGLVRCDETIMLLLDVDSLLSS